MTDKLELPLGHTVSLKMTQIKRSAKACFARGSQPQNFQYHINVQDKNGNFVQCEYLSPVEPQTAFVEGVYQLVKVVAESPRGTPEIVPGEEPSVQRVALREDPTIKSAPATEYFEDQTKDVGVNCYSVPVQGRSIAFAMGYAKDILVASIAANPRVVSQKDIDEMIKWADAINQGICNRVSF